MSEHQIIEQRQNREQEPHQRKALVNYSHFPLENQHLEVKINQNMITQNQSMNQNENQVDHQILNKLIKDHLLKQIHRISQQQKQKQTQSTQSQNQTQNMTLT